MMETMNKENMTEMSVNEMKTVSGGYNWRDLLGDALIIAALGPIGEFVVAGKAIKAIGDALD